MGDKESALSCAVVCLDCDKSAIEKAKKIGANLIITHHPVIFGGVKSVVKGDVVYELIKNDISVISMHTNLDVAVGGVTDTLCETLGLTDISPFTATDGFTIRSATVNQNADNFAKTIKEKLNFDVRYVGEGTIKNALVCSGSGGDYIYDAINNNFDALITADCKHHQFIDALNSGVALFDCGHKASEDVIVPKLIKTLSHEFSEITFTPFINNLFKCV